MQLASKLTHSISMLLLVFLLSLDACGGGNPQLPTVRVTPTPAISAIWLSPQKDFLLQGTTTTLSVRVKGIGIQEVVFNAIRKQYPSLFLCAATASAGNIYSCDWNYSSIGNGPIELGFTINPTAENIINPAGTLSGVVRYVEPYTNDIYAGYAAWQRGNPVAYQYSEVTAKWIVPPVHCSPGENSQVAIWAGLAGTSAGSKLIQIATLSQCRYGYPRYEADWEIYPDNSAILIPNHPITSGDEITATVSFSNGTFKLFMEDANKWNFSLTQAGSSSNTQMAECILEAPTLLINGQKQVAALTNFGVVSIQCEADNEPIANGPQDIRYQMETKGVAKATTSLLDNDGAGFTVQWKHA